MGVNDVKEFFTPSTGKAWFTAILVTAAMIPSSISQFPNLQFDIISQLQLILLLPWFLFNLPSLSVVGMALWFAYVYIIASIYAYAYGLIEGMLRDEFPHINDMWKKGAKKARQRAPEPKAKPKHAKKQKKRTRK
jgi:hypothetical protein